MREIKFRAWDKQTKDMLEFFAPSMEFYNKRLNRYRHFFDRHIIQMQYTGLKDKNGKEIYEGDIAKLRNRLFLAYWNSDLAAFYWEPLDQKPSYPCFNIGTVKDMEVIGNLYEHPHLLGAKGMEW